jgi:hypothetical protein
LKLKTHLILSWLFCIPALADYAWLPKEKLLVLKTGWEIFKTNENFDSFNDRRELLTDGFPSELSQNKLYLDAEYGFSNQWSGYFKSGFLDGKISERPGGRGLLSGSGLFDTALGLKWRTQLEKPIFALEGGILIPPYSVDVTNTESLAIGDGVAGIIIKAHSGTKIRRFVLSVSPGLLFRFGGFSHQALLETAASLVFKGFYFRLYESAAFSLSKEPGGNTFPNSEIGSGGSFSRLSTNPDLVTVGLKAGVNLSSKFRGEAYFTKTVWGSEAPNGFSFGINLVSLLDFYEPDLREKIKEIPFSSEQEPESSL